MTLVILRSGISVDTVYTVANSLFPDELDNHSVSLFVLRGTRISTVKNDFLEGASGFPPTTL